MKKNITFDPSSESDQKKALSAILSNVKANSDLMKRCMDNDKVMDTLKHCSSILNELKTSKLSPKLYYELYFSIFDNLQLLVPYLRDLHISGKQHLADLYELVQYAGSVVPRLYLMVTVGSVYISLPSYYRSMSISNSEEIPVNEVLQDMLEMARGIQHPVRGLFLRYYLAQMTKEYLPTSSIQSNFGNVDDSIHFLLSNFTEMNKLWVRMQHQGLTRDKNKREEERRDLRTLVGSNLLRLSLLEGVSESKYHDVILPSMLSQVVSCKDPLAQEYIMEATIQAFSDEYHIKTLGMLTSTLGKLHPKVSIKGIILSLTERISNYCINKRSESPALNSQAITESDSQLPTSQAISQDTSINIDSNTINKPIISNLNESSPPINSTEKNSPIIDPQSLDVDSLNTLDRNNLPLNNNKDTPLSNENHSLSKELEIIHTSDQEHSNNINDNIPASTTEEFEQQKNDNPSSEHKDASTTVSNDTNPDLNVTSDSLIDKLSLDTNSNEKIIVSKGLSEDVSDPDKDGSSMSLKNSLVDESSSLETQPQQAGSNKNEVNAISIGINSSDDVDIKDFEKLNIDETITDDSVAKIRESNLNTKSLNDDSISPSNSPQTIKKPQPDLRPNSFSIIMGLLTDFWAHIQKLVVLRSDLSTPDSISIVNSMLKLSISCVPQEFEFSNEILDFALTQINSKSLSTNVNDQITQNSVIGILLTPLKCYSNPLDILNLKGYYPLLNSQPSKSRRNLALALLTIILQREIFISSMQNATLALKICVYASEYDVPDTSSKFEELGLLSRFVHSFRSDDFATYLKLLEIVRNSFLSKEMTSKIILPSIINDSISTAMKINNISYPSPSGSDWVKLVIEYLRFVRSSLEYLVELSSSDSKLSLNSFNMYLLVGQSVSTQPNFRGLKLLEEAALEFFVEAMGVYESMPSNSQIQSDCLTRIVGSIYSSRNFSNDNYQVLVDRCALQATRQLKRPEQCRAFLACSHLWWRSLTDYEIWSLDNPDEKEFFESFNNSEKCLEFLVKSINLAKSCLDQNISILLLIEILNNYIILFERRCPSVSPKSINELISEIKSYLDKSDDTLDSSDSLTPIKPGALSLLSSMLTISTIDNDTDRNTLLNLFNRTLKYINLKQQAMQEKSSIFDSTENSENEFLNQEFPVDYSAIKF
ncbi:Vacuolar protein sorting-associated protein 35 [Smittium culicis]|uniref:Vacuolar protein sorting-associated protein 35 n=1 Tax=Smittium culicis TaxID=133412 RepID=A0A1R1YBX9_9FUNG|nr:Vacuolar protein sorting-associated protein 35 [Smittium culicis]